MQVEWARNVTADSGKALILAPLAVASQTVEEAQRIGVEVTYIRDQAEADRDIPKLLAVPAAVRFVSMEPLLGLVDLSSYLRPKFRPSKDPDWQDLHGPLDWVIVGGESGQNARPMHGSWAYDLHDQCEAAGVPFLFKQWGEWVNAGARAFGTAAGEVRHIRSDGTFWNEGDDALQDECADVLTVVRVGKKAAGRDLGGKLHDGYPEARP
jgi:protein gp37